MYKFKTKVSVVLFNESGKKRMLLPEKCEVEWYVDMELGTDGVNKFSFHIPDQGMKTNQYDTPTLWITKVKADMYENYDVFKEGIRPATLEINLKNNNTRLMFC